MKAISSGASLQFNRHHDRAKGRGRSEKKSEVVQAVLGQDSDPVPLGDPCLLQACGDLIDRRLY